MASPFNIFRKRQRTLLVVVGVICIVTFVIGDVLLNWVGPDTGMGLASDTVVTWKGGELTDNDLLVLRSIHARTINYLDAVVAETLRRDGQPKGAGVTRDRNGQIIDPGISRDNSELRLVRTMLLAEHAEKMGLEVPDEAIIDFLADLSDHTLSSEELRAMLQGATQGRLTREQLFDTLRRELLARNYLRLSGAGEIMTPDEAWDYYNRLTRRVTTTIVEFRAEDFLGQAPQPKPDQIRQLYEKYKNQFPYPTSPEPGFKQRAQFEFAYFKADFDKFMEQEKAKISADEVQKYYEENKERYKLPELPKVDSETPADSSSDDTPPADSASEDKGTEEATSPATPQPDDESPKASNEADAADAASEKPDASTDEPPASESAPESDADSAGSDTTTENEGECGQPEGDVAEDSAEEEESQDDAESQSNETEAQEPASESSEDTSDGPSLSEAQPKDASEESASADDASTAEAESPTTESPAAPTNEEAPEETQYQPLSEVEDDIRRTLAMPKVRDQIEKALSEAGREVSRYRKSYNSYLIQLKRNPDARRPETPNFQEIAQKLGLEFGRTPLVDELSVAETELGKTFAWGPGFQQISFAQIAMRDEKMNLYQAERISSGTEEFLYWATQVKESRVPELEEVRDEVIRAWRMQEAFNIAMQEAKQAADKIRKAAASAPVHEVAGVKESQVIRPPAFSWMTSGAIPFGGGVPYLSEVPGVENVGNDFMEVVFSLPVNGVGVAPNQSKTAVYVVRVEGETPPAEIRRDMFWQSGITANPNLFHVAQYEQQRKLLAWLDELEKEWNLEWKRPPQDTREL